MEDLPTKETGIPCFVCNQKSGIDCPGRKPHESTRCQECLKIFLLELKNEQAMHLKTLGPVVKAFDIDLWEKEGKPQNEKSFWKDCVILFVEQSSMLYVLAFLDEPYNLRDNYSQKWVNYGNALTTEEIALIKQI